LNFNKIKENIMQYTEKVMEHFSNPRNVGVIENPDGYGKVGNPSCGDIMEMFLQVENDIIEDAKFRTFGCASAIASSSISTELIKGLSIREALQITNKAVVEALGGLPPVKMHCSVLAEEAIKLAIENYLSKKNK
jgi:nitrogen fixation NifU-like protein